MKRGAISGAVAGIIVVVVIGLGALGYYFGAVLPSGQATSTGVTNSTPSSTTMMPTSSQSAMNSSTRSSSISTSSAVSSSAQSSSQSSSGQGAQLQIIAAHVSYSLSGAPVAATCGPTMPAQGSSYLALTNSGTAPTVISSIGFSFGAMGSSGGAPTGTCAVAAGATAYITLTGIGTDTASASEGFIVSLSGSNGGYAFLQGAFG